MKLVTFKYIKPNGEESNREVVEVSPVSKFFEGYDVTSMSPEDFTQFYVELNTLRDLQKQEMLNLISKYDLVHDYKRFVPERMSEVSQEHY